MAEALAGAWGTLKEAIHVYMGVSPATFFAAVVVAVVLYYAISSCLAPAPPPPRYREREFVEGEPLPPPVQVGEIADEELRQYDGSDPKKPLLMAIKGQIYDVSQSRMFYGPGGPYALFAGKDASRALAKMSFEERDLNGDLSGLGPFELDALQDWEYKFMGKYAKVGTIKKPIAPVDGESGDNAAESTATKTDNGPSEPKEQREKADATIEREQAAGTIEPKDASSMKDDIADQKEPENSEKKVEAKVEGS